MLGPQVDVNAAQFLGVDVVTTEVDDVVAPVASELDTELEVLVDGGLGPSQLFETFTSALHKSFNIYIGYKQTRVSTTNLIHF